MSHHAQLRFSFALSHIQLALSPGPSDKWNLFPFPASFLYSVLSTSHGGGVGEECSVTDRQTEEEQDGCVANGILEGYPSSMLAGHGL